MWQPDPPEALRIDPGLIARAADASLDASQQLSRTARPILSTVDIGDGWFSTLPGAADFLAAHGEILADGLDLVESIGATLEGDSDRLYQVAFAVQASDAAATARLGRPR
jgi:hypothetical protein